VGRLEDELEKIRQELQALDSGRSRLPRERIEALTEAALRGEEPEDLTPQERDLFEKFLAYVPVVRELEEEGAFFEGDRRG
jgi:hypothetical protein